jgi:hypothetical protein
MRDVWDGHGKPRVTEEAGGSREDQRWGKRRGLLSFLALLGAVGCDSSSSGRDGELSHYYYHGRNDYLRSPGRRYRYRRRRRW